MNKYRHKDYKPEYDLIFGRLLYRDVINDAEKLITKNKGKGDLNIKIPTLSEHIVEKGTYHKAIELAESEYANRFQNPPRSFPRKTKPSQTND